MFSQTQYEIFGHVHLSRLDDSNAPAALCFKNQVRGVNGTLKKHSLEFLIGDCRRKGHIGMKREGCMLTITQKNITALSTSTLLEMRLINRHF